MKKIRIAQIGVNRYSHATEIFKTLKSMPELFEIVGYAIVEDERETCEAKLPAFDGYREMTVEEILADPTIDAVTVETDEIHLLKYARLVAESGKHMHMEKPGSQSVADFESLVETVRAKGTVFHLGYMYRYNPVISDVLARARTGELGEIHSVEAHMSRIDREPCRRWLGSFKGGMMFYLGCHLVDLVYLLQGAPERVIPLNKSTGIGGIETEDYGCAVLEYPNGISMIRMSGTEIGGYDRRQLVICTDRRTVEIKPLEVSVPKEERRPGMVAPLYTESVERYRDEEGKVQTKYTRSPDYGRYSAMMQSFAAMVRGEKENPFTYDYELALFKLIMECCGAVEE